MKKHSAYLFTALLTLIAVIYNSWPLGYLLDNHTARFGVPSDLEDPHHPYSWVFIIGDVVSGLLLIAMSLYLARQLIAKRKKLAWTGLAFGLFMFGFFTGFGAAAPDKCHGRFAACVQVFHNRISIDGIETSLAALGLL
ncbi:MAG TPA: DUF998 domain-containing protein, partial [Candidatus Saccharimonadales bacterium]|nr:DUF998 domain-containing protein [Candidatus Saccharimonadales bacterium]